MPTTFQHFKFGPETGPKFHITLARSKEDECSNCAISICSTQDQWCRKSGRKLAEGRLCTDHDLSFAAPNKLGNRWAVLSILMATAAENSKSIPSELRRFIFNAAGSYLK